MRFSIAAAGFIHMAAKYVPELAYPLASMQQDMERLGFGEAKNDPLANFDRCDYGAPCMNTSTGCLKGRCMRRNPAVTYAQPSHLVLVDASDPRCVSFFPAKLG